MISSGAPIISKVGLGFYLAISGRLQEISVFTNDFDISIWYDSSNINRCAYLTYPVFLAEIAPKSVVK